MQSPVAQKMLGECTGQEHGLEDRCSLRTCQCRAGGEVETPGVPKRLLRQHLPEPEMGLLLHSAQRHTGTQCVQVQGMSQMIIFLHPD